MAFLRMIDVKRQIEHIDRCPIGKQFVNQISSRRSVNMKMQNVLTVAGTAGITMAITLMLLGPRNSSPAYAALEMKPIITQPQFRSQGCTFVLKTDKATYEAEQSPVIELTALNPSTNPVDATIWLSIMASAPESAMSRMATRPRTLWSHECVVGLLPKETKKIDVACDAKLPAGQIIYINMTDKKETIRLANPEIRTNSELRQSQLNVPQRAGVTP
jgi:hypothetical protein